MNLAIGVDVGGTGIKAAVVDVETGTLVSSRERLPTPRPGTPEAVRDTIADLIARFDQFGSGLPVGVGLPAVIQDGVVLRAPNLDESWIGTDARAVLSPALGAVQLLNDADAAAVAETTYGAAKGHSGLVLTVTFGTGIGVGVVHNGVLIPNAELGHLELDGEVAETTTSARARERLELDWPQWAARVSRYLQHLEMLLWPQLIVISGGVSKSPDLWFGLLQTRTPLALASLINNAGIVGAARAAVVR